MALQPNEGKWKAYTDGPKLYGPPGVGQNLNKDLQENVGNEIDATRQDLLQGLSAVVYGLAVSVGAGLAVNVAVGAVYIQGQRAALVGIGTLAGLPASTAGIKISIQLGTPWSNTNRSWTPTLGFTTGALGSDQMHLATVTTDGSGVIAVTDMRALWPLPASGEKAALAGTSGTPGTGNKYVTDADARNTNPRTPSLHSTSHLAGEVDEIPHNALGGLEDGDPHPQYVRVDGDIMEDELILSGNPTDPLGAVPKQMVDAIQTAWSAGPGAPSYSAVGTFTVTGDQSAYYYPGRLLRYKDTAGGSTYQYTMVMSYAGGTIGVVDNGLDSGLNSIQLANFDAKVFTFAVTGHLPPTSENNLAGRLQVPGTFEPVAAAFYVEGLASVNGATQGNTTVRLRRGGTPAADGPTDVLAASPLAYNAGWVGWFNPVHTEINPADYLQVDVTGAPSGATADDLFVMLYCVPKWAKNL